MDQRKVFSDSVVELPDQPGVTPAGMKVNAKSPGNDTEMMPVTFALAPPASANKDLEQLVAKGQTVSPDELRTKYSVSAQDVDPLVAWLKGEGFAIDQVSADGTSVYARATVAQLEKSLAVNMVRVTKGGITYNAARNAPSLPASVSANVHAIGGLQPFRHALKHFRRAVMLDRRPTKEPSATAPAAAAAGAAAPNLPPYLVSSVLKAYNADGLGLTGKGQTIAILIDTVPSDADVQAFWNRNGIPVNLSRITKINVNGAVLPGTEGEETLDAEWASGIAQGADIRIYASGSLQFGDLDRALDRIIADVATTPTMRQLSISLGLGETFMQKAELRTQHAKYLRLAALGVNVFVSSGDAGSNPDATGHGSTGPLQAEYGASDPAVIGVGGTTLRLGASGTVQEETGWPDGGGGRSAAFARPAWQKGKGVQAGANRMVPDVSLVADPNTGALIIFNGKEEQIGGTSWSAPVWAGFCAMLNEARVNAGKPPLAFLGPQLYPLAGTEAFRDIVSGSNGANHAKAGYDMVTGLGVPDVKVLVDLLTAEH
jgi:kumamolisin